MLFSLTGEFRSRALLMTAAAVVVVFILWNVPQLSFVLYPLKLFVTFIHESGHGLAALITGGRLDHFVVNPDTSGVALTRGGTLALILPAGYLGAALFGAVLFYLVNTHPYSRSFAVVLGAGLAIMSVLFTSFPSTAFILGLLSGIGLIALGVKGNQTANLLVLDVLAIVCGLNAVMDLLILTRFSDLSVGDISNDAMAFSRLAPILPGGAWAFVWAMMAVLMLWTAVWYSIIRPMRRRAIV